MTKEFHVFTHIESSHEQAFIFEVDRNIEEDRLRIRELWMITKQDSGEVRSRIKFEDMILSISETIGGNIDTENVPTILNHFSDLLPIERCTEIIEDINNQNELSELDTVRQTEADQLITASEYLKSLENTGNIDQLVNNIINKSKQ